MRRRLVHWLVRMYPLAWRERYQFEFLGLFEDEDTKPASMLVSIALCCATVIYALKVVSRGESTWPELVLSPVTSVLLLGMSTRVRLRNQDELKELLWQENRDEFRRWLS